MGVARWWPKLSSNLEFDNKEFLAVIGDICHFRIHLFVYCTLNKSPCMKTDKTLRKIIRTLTV